MIGKYQMFLAIVHIIKAAVTVMMAKGELRTAYSRG